MNRLLAAALIATLPATAPLTASAFDASDKAAVEPVVAAFKQDFTALDFTGVVEVMPPKVIDYMAKQMNMKSGELTEMLIQQLSVFSGQVTIEKFNLFLNRAKTGTTPDGIDYAFIPTKTVAKGPDGRKTFNTQTLALQDGGKWYLMRLEAPQQYAIVQIVYPGFANVKMP